MRSIRGCFYTLLGLVVVGASCSASDVAEVHEPAAVPRSEVQVAEVEVAKTPFCGESFPVFSAGLDRDDPLNVDGTAGPGPNSLPAQDGQMVSHSLQAYGASEFRWPSDDSVELLQDSDRLWDQVVAGYRSSIEIQDPTRLKVYILVDDKEDRCSVFTASVYVLSETDSGEVAVTEAAMRGLSTLRPRSELEEYLNAERELASPETLGLDRPSGRCASSVLTDVAVDYDVPVRDAVHVVRNFLADRESGARAQLCLTAEGLRSFNQVGLELYGPAPTCLFVCEDGPSPNFDTAIVSNHFGWTGTGASEDVNPIQVVLSRVDPAGSPSTVREYYRVVAVEGFGGQTEARIQAIWTEVDSYVDYDRGVEFLTTFLQDLAAERYDVACCVYNEGTSEQILAQLGEDWEVPLAQKFETYCQTAYCIAEFEIVDQASSTQSSRDYIVRFDTVDGPFTVRVGVSTWEGRYTVNSMPPSQWIADEGERTDQCGC